MSELHTCVLVMSLAWVIGCGEGPEDNDSFAAADRIDVEDEPFFGVIDPPGDVDFYSFEGSAGDWLVFMTDTTDPESAEELDTVLTLYDESMNPIAENDDRMPGSSPDSEIVTRLPQTGTYFLQVQDRRGWAGEAPRGNPSFEYELETFLLDRPRTGITTESEQGDGVGDADFVRTVTGDTSDFGLIVGGFRDEADVDVFELEVTREKHNPQIFWLPGSPMGSGSTSAPGALWLTDAAGERVLARIDASSSVRLTPVLSPGSYRLWVDRSEATGANDFYVLKFYRFASDNPREREESTNGVAASAEPLALEEEEDGSRRGYLLAQLPSGDVDHFRFPAVAGDAATVVCASRSVGSGVIGLEATILDATGVTEIASASETGRGLRFEVPLPAGGTHYLRLTKRDQDREVQGDWVRCGVTLR